MSPRPLPAWFLEALTFYLRSWPGHVALRVIVESHDGQRAVLPVPDG